MGAEHEKQPSAPHAPVVAAPVPAAQAPVAPVPLSAELADVARSATDPSDPFGGTQTPPALLATLQRRRSTGRALPKSVAEPMSEQLGTDLSGVRVHTDSEADEISRSIQAKAFSHGEDVYFSSGTFAPETESGQRLLAHELAHVAQHRSGQFAGGSSMIGKKDDPAEAAADAAADAAVSGLRRKAFQPGESGESSQPAPTGGLMGNKHALATPERSGQQQSPAPAVSGPSAPVPLTVAGAGPTSSTIHRWPWSKKDPEKERREREEKEAKKRAKAEKKAQDKAKATAVKEHKALEQSESKELARQRGIGVAKRGEMAKGVSEGVAGKDGTTKTGAEYVKDLHARFAANLEIERETYEDLLADGVPATEAAEKAYEVCWVLTNDYELNAVRPPRQTAAERLMRDIRQARTDDQLGTVDDKGNVVIAGETNLALSKTGLLLPKEVEEVYEKWERELDRLTKDARTGQPRPDVDPKVADINAGLTVWAQADPKVRLQRPTDPRLEREGRKQARTRVDRARPQQPDGTFDSADKYTGYASTVGGPIGSAIGALGSKITKDKAAGVEKDSDGNWKDGYAQEQKQGLEEYLPGIGDVKQRKRLGIKDDKDLGKVKDSSGNLVDEKISRDTQISRGFGSASSVLNDLLGLVNGVVKAAKACSEAHEATGTNAHHKRLQATKACASGASTAVKLGNDAADLAKNIDGSVVGGVMSVLPGFNLASSILGMITSAVELADHSMRMSQTNTAITDARSRTPGTKSVDVLVFPLLHMQEGWTKKLEQTSWTTGVQISNFATNVATIAGGGAFGVPAAVQVCVGIVDKLHTVAHVVADQILVKLAKESQAEEVGKLEGSAEKRLHRDPATAIDGIVVRARGGDAVALKLLSNYGIDEKEVKTGQLGKIRTTVLGVMGETEDPEYLYETVGKTLGGFQEKWKQTGELAKQRNDGADKGKSDRGFGWKLKMMIKSVVSEDGWKASVNKTKTQVRDESQIICRVGKHILLADSNETEIGRFVSALETASDQDLAFAIGDAKNSSEGKEVLVEVFLERSKKASAGAAVGA